MSMALWETTPTVWPSSMALTTPEERNANHERCQMLKRRSLFSVAHNEVVSANRESTAIVLNVAPAFVDVMDNEGVFHGSRAFSDKALEFDGTIRPREEFQVRAPISVRDTRM
jgi:hypothetical protein